MECAMMPPDKAYAKAFGEDIQEVDELGWAKLGREDPDLATYQWGKALDEPGGLLYVYRGIPAGWYVIDPECSLGFGDAVDALGEPQNLSVSWFEYELTYLGLSLDYPTLGVSVGFSAFLGPEAFADTASGRPSHLRPTCRLSQLNASLQQPRSPKYCNLTQL